MIYESIKKPGYFSPGLTSWVWIDSFGNENSILCISALTLKILKYIIIKAYSSENV